MAISQRDVVHERRHWLEFLIFGILVSSSFAADAITPEVQWPRFSVGGSGAMVMEGGRIRAFGPKEEILRPVGNRQAPLASGPAQASAPLQVATA